MSEFKFQQYALMCMRLAAECRGLAADVPEPDLRAHFLHMASMWTELEHLPRRLNRLWIHMTVRIRFNIHTGTKGPVMNGEALF